MHVWHDTPDAPRPEYALPGEAVELVIGTWPIEPGQEVAIELTISGPGGDQRWESVAATWYENIGPNSYWRARIGPGPPLWQADAYASPGWGRPGPMPGPCSEGAMPASVEFAARLHEQVAVAEAAHADRLRANESAMRERQAQGDQFVEVASALHQSVVRPMIEELTAHFANATTEHYQTPLGINSACRFAPTDRFPASVRLLIGIGQDECTGAALTYDLEIIPLLCAYDKTDSYPIDLPRPNESALRERLGAWLLRFTETYLQLETDPRYQKWHAHTDPVCGMRISGATTAQTIQLGRRRYYFCSQSCREKFEAQPAIYAKGFESLTGS